MKKIIKRIFPFIPAILCMAVIFAFSSQDKAQSTEVSNAAVEVVYGADKVGSFIPTVIIRKAAHFLEYAALGALLYFGISMMNKNKSIKFRIVVSTFVGAVYAATDELHQYFVPGRAAMLSDVLLDSCGVIFGVLCAAMIFRIIMKITEESRKNK